MRKSRFQFRIRGLLILMLAFACFFAGWTAGHRDGQRDGENLRLQAEALVEGQVNSEFKLLKKSASYYSENVSLKRKIAALEEMVEKLKTRPEEVNAVLEQPGGDQ